MTVLLFLFSTVAANGMVGICLPDWFDEKRFNSDTGFCDNILNGSPTGSVFLAGKDDARTEKKNGPFERYQAARI